MSVIPFLFKALDASGIPLIGGKLYTYAADGITLKATYTDATGQFSAANPLILNGYGQTLVFANPGVLPVNLTDSADNQMPYYPASITVPSVLGQTSLTGITGNSGVFAVQDFISTPNQTVFILDTGYIPDTNNIVVYHNGVRLNSGTDYTETDVNTITLLVGANLNDIISISSAQGLSDPTGVAAALVLRQDLADTTNVAHGSAMIGAKLVGGVARTQADKNNEYVSVKDFGAIGDGITDDTIAIQAALDSFPLNTTSVGVLSPKGYAQGGCLYFPRGRYKITSRLTMRRGLHILGESHEASQLILFTLNGGLYYADNGRYVQDEFLIENISLWQDTSVTPTSGAAVMFRVGTVGTSIAPMLHNVLVEGTYYGFEMDGLGYSTISNCRIGGCVSHGIYCWAEDYTSTSTTVQNTYAEQCGGDGFRFTTGSYVSFVGCASDSNTGFGYNIQGAQCVQMVASGAEQNAAGGMYIGASDSVTFTLRVAATKDTDAVQISNCRAVTSIGSYFEMLNAATATTGYAINVLVPGGALTTIGTRFVDTRYAAHKCNITTSYLDLDGTSGLVGSGANWAINNQARAIESTAGFLLSGDLAGAVTRAQVINNTHTIAGASRNTQQYLQAFTADTAVTYPLVTGSYTADTSKGTASTITRSAGNVVVEQTAGATANANLLIEVGAAVIPPGNWSHCNMSTRENLFYGGFRFTSSTGQRLSFGAGSPEGVVTAPTGSLYMRTDGAAGTSFYVKETGTSNTGWVGK